MGGRPFFTKLLDLIFCVDQLCDCRANSVFLLFIVELILGMNKLRTRGTDLIFSVHPFYLPSSINIKILKFFSFPLGKLLHFS